MTTKIVLAIPKRKGRPKTIRSTMRTRKPTKKQLAKAAAKSAKLDKFARPKGKSQHLHKTKCPTTGKK